MTSIDRKKLAQVRRSLVNTIDDFKHSILESFKVAQEQGPLTEPLGLSSRDAQEVVGQSPQPAAVEDFARGSFIVSPVKLGRVFLTVSPLIITTL